MTREEAIQYLNKLYLWSDITDEFGDMVDMSPYAEAVDMATEALEQEPCKEAISRDAVEDKLLKLCNEIECIFANIRMQNQDESVCGLCEYDCPAPYECPGFDRDDCFKLADEIRHKWQSTKDLPFVIPQYTDAEIQKMQEMEQAEIQKAYELGKENNIKILDKIRAEIDRQEKWLLQAGYTAYNIDIAFDAIKLAVESEDKCKKCEYFYNPDYTRCHECMTESEDK